MGLKVIGAGWGRTGTASLKLALEMLGFAPCYHMMEVIANPPFMPLWMDVAKGRPDWDRIFAGYKATVDFPACLHWRALRARWPDAKLILSRRQSSEWYESTQETIFSARIRETVADSPFGLMLDAVLHKPLGVPLDDRERLIAAYERHNEEVIAEVPKDRLLVFEAKDGWGPLCQFLDVPVPEVAFPRVNSREEFAAMLAAGGPKT